MEVTFAAGLNTIDLTDNSNKADDGKGSSGTVSNADQITQHSPIEKSNQANSELSGSISSDSGSSKYLTGLMESIKSEKTFRNKMNSLVGALSTVDIRSGKYLERTKTSWYNLLNSKYGPETILRQVKTGSNVFSCS